ncbi:MAG: ammonia-forming cytochrome c nitrite reductase subunit c552 [Candidatus Krumholzibacteria bacterium]|jgi:nitrite reductase (cytochrome c-552)|nr:ammonia-forming cytochrome c nitrite reductase subunit c552 [Candidatus Krumholzibacteria bacterium]
MKDPARPGLPVGAAVAIVILSAAVVFLLGMLGVSIMEHRWEARRPAIALRPVDEWEMDSAVWGSNYPREYEGYLSTEIDDSETKFGGAFPRDYLEADPLQVILFAGYGFSREYRQGRGHFHAIEDVTSTKRINVPYQAASCWTCKSPDVPRLMAKIGEKAFYGSNFHDLKGEITHSIGCRDCHDPESMELVITRPALKEALASTGMDLGKATHQQMRSLVCAQCHVEYYFLTDERDGKKDYLTLPWERGEGVDGMIDYYDGYGFSDFIHPVSGTPMIKSQHPDYEMYSSGIHAYRNVSCADCHMPYVSEGGMKHSDHHVRSPLLNISNSCAVCHRWTEEEIRGRVESIQTACFESKMAAEEALVKAHFDVAAAAQAGATDGELEPARRLLRHAQFRWDYVSSNNGMGFHSPQEYMRISGAAADGAQQARLLAARLLAAKGFYGAPVYPDISTREKALEVARGFVEGRGAGLLK